MESRRYCAGTLPRFKSFPMPRSQAIDGMAEDTERKSPLYMRRNLYIDPGMSHPLSPRAEMRRGGGRHTTRNPAVGLVDALITTAIAEEKSQNLLVLSGSSACEQLEIRLEPY
jgi:hypothetical protein